MRFHSPVGRDSSRELGNGLIPDPTDAHAGVLDAYGGPDQMLLPFVRLAEVLNNSESFESIRFNEHVEAVMFHAGTRTACSHTVPSHREQSFFLGEGWAASDVWGGMFRPKTNAWGGDQPEDTMGDGRFC